MGRPDVLADVRRRSTAAGLASAGGKLGSMVTGRRPPDPSSPPAGGVGAESEASLAARVAAAAPEDLAALAADPRAGVRRRVASHPETPPAVLARLAEDGNLWVRADAAANPSTPAAALDRLRRAGSAAGLAGPAPPDPDLDPAELSALAAGGEWARRLAARHPATPPEALARLLADPVPAIRAAAAAHPSAPAAAPEPPAEPTVRLEELITAAGPADGADPPLAVALALAAHPSVPPSLLARLAEHGALAVRAAVAENPALDPGRLEILRRAGSRADLAAFEPPDPALPASDLARLAAGGGWARLLAARHPTTAPADLARLAADADPLVRAEAFRNPGCPERVRNLLRRAGGAVDPLLAPAGGDDQVIFEGCAAAEIGELEALGPWGRVLAARHRALKAIGGLEEDAAERLEASLVWSRKPLR
jgi:hypothetical protein